MLFTQTALAAGLLVLPLATAAPSKRGSFKLPLRRDSNRKLIIDDADLHDIYSATDWTVAVSIGGQAFNMQVDTGSSDTWILSTNMPASKQSQFSLNHFYDPSKSTTFKDVAGSSFNITYGNAGNIFGSGKVGTDDIKIGTAVVNMEFGLADDCSPSGMVDSTYDGLLGLAFGAGNTFKPKPGPTFMEAVQSQLDEPVFTFNIPYSAGSKQMLQFGHVDHSLYKGTLATAAINNGSSSQANGWLGTASLSVGGKTISAQSQQLLFDTGGITGTARPDTVKAYWSQVKGAKDTSQGQDGTGWAAPCSGVTPPDLTYDFDAPSGGKASGTVPGHLMISTQTLSTDNSMCSGALQSDGGSGSGNLGYAFFHAMFTVFDQSKATVSFAPYSDASQSGTSSSSSSSASGSVPSSVSNAASGDSSSVSSVAAPPSTVTGPAVKPSATGSGTKPSPTGTGSSAGTNTAAAGGASGTAAAAAPTSSDAAPGGKKNAGGRIEASGVMLALAAVVGIFAL